MRIGDWLMLLYAGLCVLALAAIPLSAAGWITPDPLSAVPALLLGLPWSFLAIDAIGAESVAVNSGLLAAAMAINAALIWLLVRVWRRRRRG